MGHDPEKEQLQRGIDFVRKRCEALIEQADRHKDDTYTDTELRIELAKIATLGSAAKLLLSDMDHAMKGQDQ